MKKGNPFAFGSNARTFIDKLYACSPAAIQHFIEIVDRKADVMNTGAAAREKLADWSVIPLRLEQLHQAFSRGNGRDARAVRIGKLDWRHSEYVAEKRQLTIDRRESNPDVSDSGPFKGFILH